MSCHQTCSAGTCLDLIMVLRVFLLAVLSILFLQSGLDKVFNWKGNLEWLKGHFANSLFKNIVPLLLSVLTVQEVLAGTLSLAGIFVYLITGITAPAVWGIILGLTSFVSLFLGQRLAKDYAGAGGLVPYMILNALALYLFV